MIQLQERDRRILRQCYEQQFLVMSHLIEFHFRGRHIGEAYRRVQELEKAGYLLKLEKETCRQIRLTPEGRRIAQEESPWTLPAGLRPNLNERSHDTLVTSVRLRLEELWEGHWKPSAILRDERRREAKTDAIGDGLFTFPSGRIAAIEVENLHQKGSTWRGLFRNWENSVLNHCMVLFIFSNETILNGAREVLQTGEFTQPIFLMLFDDLIHFPSKGVWSIRGTINLFQKRSY